MNQDKRETLSALLDDELTDREVDGVATDLADDRGLRLTMARYRLIGAVLRGEGDVPVPQDFADRVGQLLRDEPTVLVPAAAPRRASWLRPAAGLAIAASVAMLAIGLLSTQPEMVGEEPGVQIAATSPPVAVQASPGQLAEAGGLGGALDAAEPAPNDGALTRYLAEHNEFASRGGASGFMSYTTFVTYDGR